MSETFLRVSESSAYVFDRVSAWATGGYVQLQAGQLEEAQASLQRSIAAYESTWAQLDADSLRVAGRDFYSIPYELLQRTQVAAGQPADALMTSESARARSFFEQMTDKSQAKTAQEPPRVAHAPIDLEGAQSLVDHTGATFVVYELLFDPGQLLLSSRFSGTQPALEETLLIWVLRPGKRIHLESVDLTRPTQRSLTRQVDAVRDRLGSGGRGAARIGSTSQQPLELGALAELLIAPIRDYLPKTESRLVFLPRGPLFLVPFAALPMADGRPLIEHHTVSLAPSLAIAQELERRRSTFHSAGGQGLVVGDPAPKDGLEAELGTRLPRLPGARKEARIVAELLGTEPLLDAAATDGLVTRSMPNARWIHFASHGLLDHGDSGGLPGALVLAPDGSGEGGDGLLTASEIAELPLQAQLVVASACDTGGGRLTGDGVLGLARSFLTAGAGAAVVSLWQIDDEATTHLMSQFYRHLLQDPDVAAALRRAMLETRQVYPSPQQWASFVALDAPGG